MRNENNEIYLIISHNESGQNCHLFKFPRQSWSGVGVKLAGTVEISKVIQLISTALDLYE